MTISNITSMYIVLISLIIIAIGIVISPFLPNILFRKTKIIKIRKDVFKILKELASEPAVAKDTRELPKKSEEDFNFTINWMAKRKFISKLKNNKIKITQKGLLKVDDEYLNTVKRQDDLQHKYITILLSILSILLVYVALQIQVGALNLQAIQTDLLNKSNAPRQAFLEIIPDKDDFNFAAFDIADKRNIASSGWPGIDLTIINFGQMDSNLLRCYSEPSSIVSSHLEGGQNIGNIEEGSSVRANLLVRYDDCYNTHEEGCNPDVVPLGNYNITLKCECYGCKDQREFDSVIPICIWKQSSIECNV